MRIYKDFSGEKVGMLTIQSFANKRNTSGSVWNAVCECGNKKEIASREIRRAKKDQTDRWRDGSTDDI